MARFITSIDAGVLFTDTVDNTKKAQLDISAVSTATTRIITLPNANTTLCGVDTVDILSNKTLLTPAIQGDITFNETTNNLILTVSDQTVSAPTLIIPDLAGVSGEVIVNNATQTLTNKTIDASLNSISGLIHGIEVDDPTNGVHGVIGNVVGTTDTQTLTNKTITSPIIDKIADANNNEVVIFTNVASAVNEITVTNATTATNPKIIATGGDANIGVDFQVKGTGVYRFLGTTATHAEIRLYEDTDNGTNYAAWAAPASLAGNVTLRFPTTVGTNGQVLSTNGSNPATLTWVNRGTVSNSGTSTDNAIVRWNGTTGLSIQNSAHSIGDNGELVLGGTSAYIDLPDITAPANPANGVGRLYKKSGNDGLFWKSDSAGAEVDLTLHPKSAILDLSLGTDFSSSATIWKKVRGVIYAGSSNVNPISAVYAYAKKDTNITNFRLRLQDVSNNLTIATTTLLTNTAFGIIDFGIISNVPINSAFLEVQLEVNGGSSDDFVHIGAASIYCL